MVKWIKAKGWLRGYQSRNRNNVEASKVIKESEEIRNGNGDIVTFTRPRCRKCGNKDNLKCYGAYGTIRYYRCQCGHEFKAMEEES